MQQEINDFYSFSRDKINALIEKINQNNQKGPQPSELIEDFARRFARVMGTLASEH